MIRQFDVVANPDLTDVADRPYVVVLQSDLISDLTSTVVAPLVPRARMTGARRLNSLVNVEGQEYWLAMHELFAMDRRMLRRPVASIVEQRDAVIAALDLLFTGF